MTEKKSNPVRHQGETKKMAYDSKIERVKGNLKLSYGGPRLRQASGTYQSMKVLCQGRHRGGGLDTRSCN